MKVYLASSGSFTVIILESNSLYHARTRSDKVSEYIFSIFSILDRQVVTNSTVKSSIWIRTSKY